MGFTGGRRTQDYYQALGVSPEATFREIEDAYWRLVKDGGNKDKIPLLNEAYEVLSHSARRLAYDDERRARQAAGGSATTGRPSLPGGRSIQGKIWNSNS
jgi:curved DNA-binding protein CbpA